MMRPRNLLICAAATMAWALPLAAQEARATLQLASVRAEDDGVDRMRLADSLPMLAPRVAAASCALSSGVDVVHARGRLERAVDAMDVTLAALRHGDDKLGIEGPETGARLVRGLDALEGAWKEKRGAAKALIADETADPAAADTRDLQELGTVLSADFVGAYSDPFAVTQADALLFAIASRQKMLTQQIALASCDIWAGRDPEAARARLVETMGYYEKSLRALKEGDPETGLAEAPTLRIDAQINTMLSRWAGVRLSLDALLAGEPVGLARRASVFHVLDGELKEYDKLVIEYQKHATRVY